MFVDKDDKRKLLETLFRDTTICRALVFSRTKHNTDRICKHLVSRNIAAGAIHGNKSQNVRTRALEGFRTGKIRVLVATDIAARGIDVDDITHVINFDLPNEPESYVHRIGRTARAGRSGKAISFCSGDEVEYLSDIERIIKRKVPVEQGHAFHSDDAANGLEDGVPAESPCKRQARKQAERNGQRRKAGTRLARRSPQRQSIKTRQSKGAAPVKSQRRRTRRRAG